MCFADCVQRSDDSTACVARPPDSPNLIYSQLCFPSYRSCHSEAATTSDEFEALSGELAALANEIADDGETNHEEIHLLANVSSSSSHRDCVQETYGGARRVSADEMPCTRLSFRDRVPAAQDLSPPPPDRPQHYGQTREGQAHSWIQACLHASDMSGRRLYV